MKFELKNGNIRWLFEGDETGVHRVLRKERTDEKNYDSAKELAAICEVQIRGRMLSGHFGSRHIHCSETGKFAYVSHELKERDGNSELTIVQKSDIAKLTSHYSIAAGTDTVRVWHEIENIATENFTLEYIGTYGDILINEPRTFDQTELWIPTNGSYCECQWNICTLKDLGVFGGHNARSTKKLLISNTGTWSTKNYIPMGLLRERNGHITLWQVEANGSWSYELSDLYDSVTLHINGPTFEEHNWQQTLAPHEKFETLKAAVTEAENFNDAIANLTRYRRSIVRKTADAVNQPIIFNEYMYASWNTPSYQTARKLAPVAKEFGADYYVIDCGWHDEESDPFYYIGKWEESSSRYPEGLQKTMEEIRDVGLIPGLWIEAEVVGAEGNAKELYTDDCYFSHGGKVLGISDRYQLDFRRDKVRERLNGVIDGMVEKYGIEYLKLDYNIEAGCGTDFEAESCGQGLLQHNRAVFDWLKGIAERHPNLVLENCASGGNRMDYLMMSVANMQSTSDQTDYKVYPYIAANMFWALLPEQAAVWAYPAATADEVQPSEECVIMNMINGMAGRMHLASRLDWLDEKNARLVKEATSFYKTLSAFRAKAVPFFAGRPAKMDDGQIAFGLRDEEKLLLFVYRMDGEEEVSIDTGREIARAKTVYPAASVIQPKADGRKITVKFAQTYSARVIQIDFINGKE